MCDCTAGACPPQYVACDGAPGSLRLRCVHEEQVCDGVPNCADLSDERDCFHFTDPLAPPAPGQRLWCASHTRLLYSFDSIRFDSIRFDSIRFDSVRALRPLNSSVPFPLARLDTV